MTDLNYKAQCNLLIDVQKNDRFYMDMRVYEIVDADQTAVSLGMEGLVWRGIVLAVEVNPFWPNKLS